MTQRSYSTNIIYLLLFICSCGVVSCSSSNIARSTAISSPTLTPTSIPSRTAAPVLRNYTPTQAPTIVPSRTPKPTDNPTRTPTPTFVARTPLPNPAEYQLAEWSPQKALDTVFILDQEWQKRKEENTWIYAQTGINWEKRPVTLVMREAMMRYPELGSREDLQWELTQDLSTAGQQDTTKYLAKLLQSSLDRDPSLLSSSIPHLHGFMFESQKVKNFSTDFSDGWIVKSRPVDRGMGGGGTVFFVTKNANGHYIVNTVGGYWLPYWGQDLEVYISPKTTGKNPEISVSQWSSHGTGPSFRESWLCVFQWQDHQWVPMLTGSISETSYTFGIDFPIDQSCFVAQGFMSEPAYQLENSDKNSSISVWKALDSESCDWDIEYHFKQVGDTYQQQAVIKNIWKKLTYPYEIFCLDKAWSLANVIENKEDIISFMENTLAAWPELNRQTWKENFSMANVTNPSFEDELRFQLARFYALSGNRQKAKENFERVVNVLPENTNKWTFFAKHYLMNMDDISRAEDEFAKDLSSLNPGYADFYSARLIFEKLGSLLAGQGSTKAVKSEILSEISKAEPSCYGGSNYNCPELFYMLAMIYEMEGNEREAANSYWFVWQNYPDSLYSIAAQLKLEPVWRP